MARYLWAMLLARIYEALPLQCPICHASMRIIALINDARTVKKILDHIGESTQPPRVAPARGPPLWEAAAAAEQANNDPQWDWSAHCAPESAFDQRSAWAVGGGRLVPDAWRVATGGHSPKIRQCLRCQFGARNRRLTAAPGVRHTRRKLIGFPILNAKFLPAPETEPR